MWSDPSVNATLDQSLDALERGTSTPFGVAATLIEGSTDILTRTGP